MDIIKLSKHVNKIQKKRRRRQRKRWADWMKDRPGTDFMDEDCERQKPMGRNVEADEKEGYC